MIFRNFTGIKKHIRIRTCQAPAQPEKSRKAGEETDAAESDDGGYGEEEEIVFDRSGLATYVAGDN